MHLLSLMTIRRHIFIIPSPQLPLGSPLGVVQSMGLGKCAMLRFYHYGIVQGVFTALEILCVLPIHPSPCPYPNLSRAFLYQFAPMRKTVVYNEKKMFYSEIKTELVCKTWKPRGWIGFQPPLGLLTQLFKRECRNSRRS